MKKLSGVSITEEPSFVEAVSLRWKNGVRNFDRTPGGFSFTDAENALKNIIC